MIFHGMSRNIFRHPGSSWDKLSMDLLVVVNSRPQLRTGCWLLLRDVGIWTHRDGQARTKDVQTCLQHLWMFQTLRSRRAVRSPGWSATLGIFTSGVRTFFRGEKNTVNQIYLLRSVKIYGKSMRLPRSPKTSPRLLPRLPAPTTAPSMTFLSCSTLSLGQRGRQL